MDQQPTKRELREHKRALKRQGNQRLRRLAKRDLVERPDEAADAPAEDYGRFSTRSLNGKIDRDPTRLRHRPAADDVSGE